VPPRIALLTNPTSGKGKGARVSAAVAPRLRDAGFDVEELAGRDADEALDLARGCVADGVETLAVVGGDGMVHLAIQALAGSGTRLGLVPAGTGNDVARYLDLPRKSVHAATDVLIGGKERTIDLARVGARYFVTVLAAGFDAKVNERANGMTWPKGQMRYNLAILRELPLFKAIPYVVTVDGVRHETKAMLVVVGNGPSYGGGMQVLPDAQFDDGLLDVLLLHEISTVEFLKVFPKVFKGAHVGHPAVEIIRGRSVTLEAAGIVAYADGERFGALPVTVECVPGALNVLS